VTEREITEAELAELVRRTEVATSAFMRGDVEQYLELTSHASGYTLANPLGGVPDRYDDRAASVRGAADWFQAGEVTLEQAAALARG
jgi:hypothetical protein